MIVVKKIINFWRYGFSYPMTKDFVYISSGRLLK